MSEHKPINRIERTPRARMHEFRAELDETERAVGNLELLVERAKSMTRTTSLSNPGMRAQLFQLAEEMDQERSYVEQNITAQVTMLASIADDPTMPEDATETLVEIANRILRRLEKVNTDVAAVRSRVKKRIKPNGG